jgi:ABC-type uncharacterized transport system permease subunit
MLDLAFFTAVTLYGLAGALLLAHLAGASSRTVLVVWGTRLLMVAALAHAVHDVTRWATLGGGPFAGIREGLSTLGLLVVGGFLGVHHFQRRIDPVGAFVAPLTLLMLLASRESAGRSDAHLGGALIVAHVGSTLLGTAAFTVASAMAAAYLVQERQVKRKRLGGVFQRLPPLDVLDEIGYRCVAVGLPALTLGIVTGFFVARAASPTRVLAAWQQYVGMGAWALFATVLILRLAAGWRGRRAAIGTILGYSCALVVLAGYYARSGAQ